MRACAAPSAAGCSAADVVHAAGGDVDGLRIAVWGLTFVMVQDAIESMMRSALAEFGSLRELVDQILGR